jgi:effector-binding domain-containing protein
MTEIYHHIREETIFASIRQTIKERKDLHPIIDELDSIDPKIRNGDLTLIFHYDTPVDGFDAELGYPVSKMVEIDRITSRKLGYNEFLATKHKGDNEGLRAKSREVYELLYKNGISPGMELVEILKHVDREKPENNITEIQASIHLWVYLYLNNLIKFLGKDLADRISKGYQKITPLTNIADRKQWVKGTLEKLKANSTEHQQFEIMSNIALTRPSAEMKRYKDKYKKTQDIREVIKMRIGAQPWVSEPRVEGNIIYTSKTPRQNDKYREADTFDEKRKYYCFCILVANCENPDIDPIFCYRAAGWARQLWETVLDLPVVGCTLEKSILNGDEHCEFALHFEKELK